MEITQTHPPLTSHPKAFSSLSATVCDGAAAAAPLRTETLKLQTPVCLSNLGRRESSSQKAEFK